MQVNAYLRPSVAEEKSQVPEDDFLLSLGKRVRELRNRRGMTRKMMAYEADVSERHLAQIETGEGNVSIVLLRRITEALNVSLAELFAPETEERNADLIQRFLRHLSANRRDDFMQRLMREFGHESRIRRGRVALIGLKGAGKSTLGSRLSAKTKVPFIELDSEIEKEAGMPLAEIFSFYGQSGYHSIEKRTLKRVLDQPSHLILSAGGGIVSEKETYEYLTSNCYTIWIKAKPEEHMVRVIAQGDVRAIAGNNQAMEDLRQILNAREPLYRQADLCIDTSGHSIEESFSKLTSAWDANLE